MSALTAHCSNQAHIQGSHTKEYAKMASSQHPDIGLVTSMKTRGRNDKEIHPCKEFREWYISYCFFSYITSHRINTRILGQKSDITVQLLLIPVLCSWNINSNRIRIQSLHSHISSYLIESRIYCNQYDGWGNREFRDLHTCHAELCSTEWP